MDKEMFLSLFKSIVRPHVEYRSNVWYTTHKKYAIAIENVQRRATKLVKSIKDLCYQDRLKFLGLPSLEYRRIRSDMVKVYKILNQIDEVDTNQCLNLN